MATTDLFDWLNALYTKKRPEGTPPIFVMHRFLASERDLAPAAREIQLVHHDPAMAFAVWQGLLPRGSGAPRLSYAAAKKPPAAEALIMRMVQVTGERRAVVEQMYDLLTLAGREADLYPYFGLEVSASRPSESVIDADGQLVWAKKKGSGKKPKAPAPPKPPGGLFAL